MWTCRRRLHRPLLRREWMPCVKEDGEELSDVVSCEGQTVLPSIPRNAASPLCGRTGARGGEMCE
jgi:hypothetical protein